ncbi:hypothetical protein V9T40_012721 [Parthenolecanium corni]|uniref:Uncharacterized protein n=1 Tax=Parthenolecanium corni TaxID=536013 RepID=A0AAN9Y0Q0_9HEMI
MYTKFEVNPTIRTPVRSICVEVEPDQPMGKRPKEKSLLKQRQHCKSGKQTLGYLQRFNVHALDETSIKKCEKWEIVFEDESFSLRMVFCVPESEVDSRYLLSPTGEIEPSLYVFNWQHPDLPNLVAKILLSNADMWEVKALKVDKIKLLCEAASDLWNMNLMESGNASNDDDDDDDDSDSDSDSGEPDEATGS